MLSVGTIGRGRAVLYPLYVSGNSTDAKKWVFPVLINGAMTLGITTFQAYADRHSSLRSQLIPLSVVMLAVVLSCLRLNLKILLIYCKLLQNFS